MTRDRAGLLHPRLTVVSVAAGTRPAIEPAPGRTVVGPAELTEAMEAVAERRRVVLRGRIADLEAELAEACDAAGAAEAAADERRADRDAFEDAAAWVESTPTAFAALQGAIDAAESALAGRARSSRDAGRALDRVLEQRAQADAAVGEARRQLETLRASSADSAERQQAAAELEAQAASVEARLAEAEADARARMAQAKRAETEVERELEEMGRRLRDDRHRLSGLVECLPVEARPPLDQDPVRHVGDVAAGLRELADVVEEELTGLEAEADRRRADRDARARQVDAARWSLDRVATEDAAEAIADLAGGVPGGLVVLDDVVAARTGGEHGLLRALETTEPPAALVVLSSDPAVLGWAIDLPAERGVVLGTTALEALIEPTGDGHPLERQHALASSLGDQP